MSLKRAARHELQSPEPWRVISTKPRVALRVRPLHRARVVDRHTPQPWVAFAPRRSRRCVVVDRVSSLAARVVVGPRMRAILAFPSSRHGSSPNARIERHLADVATTVRDWDGDAFPRLDGVARLRVCAARLAASFARSPVALTVRRRARQKVFTMPRTARRRDGAGSTRREISRVRVPRPLRTSMRAAPRGGVLGSRARRSPRVPGDASHAGCFIRVFAYRRDAFLVFWSFDTDPFVPPRLHSSRPLASSSRSTTLVSLSTSRRTSASLRMSPSSPPSVFATRSPVSPRTS